MRWYRRRLVASGAAAVAAPWLAFAQSVRRSRLCWLQASNSFDEPYSVAFVRRLSELGFVDGRNLKIERRHADNRLERLPGAAADLAKQGCDVFFGGGSEASLAALADASRVEPIIFVAVDFDPVATGDVASLARPGGRVTGVTALQSSLPAKRLELLQELLPNMKKVAVLSNEQTAAQLSLVQGTARRIGVAVHVVDLKRPPFNYEAGFADAVHAKTDALFLLGSGLWVPARHKITDLALKARLPGMFLQSQWVEAGGVMSYGFSFPSLWSRGAEMVASILRGTKVGDIPMEQPTNFELAVNLKTARALGIKVPQSILLRANRVIE